MSASSKRKGSAFEREVVEIARGYGIPAERIPLSGAAGGSFTGDVIFRPRGGPTELAECKKRQSGGGFAMIERWLGTNDLLFLRRNHAPPLVVMNAHRYFALMQRAYGPDLEVMP